MVKNYRGSCDICVVLHDFAGGEATMWVTYLEIFFQEMLDVQPCLQKKN